MKSKNIVKVVIAILAVFTMVSCKTLPNLNQSVATTNQVSQTVSKGMSKSQVRSIMGRPDTEHIYNGIETWIYRSDNQFGGNTAYGIGISMLPGIARLPAALMVKDSIADERSSTTITFNHSGRVTGINRNTVRTNNNISKVFGGM